MRSQSVPHRRLTANARHVPRASTSMRRFSAVWRVRPGKSRALLCKVRATTALRASTRTARGCPSVRCVPRAGIAAKRRPRTVCSVLRVATRPTLARPRAARATQSAQHTSSTRDVALRAPARVRLARKDSSSRLLANTAAQRVLLAGSAHRLGQCRFANLALPANTSFPRASWHVRSATTTAQQGNATQAAVVAVLVSVPAAHRANSRAQKDSTAAKVAQLADSTLLPARPPAPTVHRDSTRMLPPAHLARRVTCRVPWVNIWPGAVAQAQACAPRAPLGSSQPPPVHTDARRARAGITRGQPAALAVSRARASRTKTWTDRARASRATTSAPPASITAHAAAPAPARASSAPVGNTSRRRGARGAGVAVLVGMRQRRVRAGASFATV